MPAPKIEINPLKPFVGSDVETTLDLLIKITPPSPELNAARPPLNIGLVLDRSGSMSTHKKINFAREAAIYAVQQLLPSDRVSFTVFDDRVETLVPNTNPENKQSIIDKVNRVEPRGSTALHAGWQEGGLQVKENLLGVGLNRVILLSDGLANVGETNSDNIATDVRRFVDDGVTTTTMGLGDDYNEKLLEAMSQSGDGNYYYIETPQQLADIFQTELQGLIATVGFGLTLDLRFPDDITDVDVLNEFEKNSSGKWRLPNLIAGMPIFMVVRVTVPATTTARDICQLNLTWKTSQNGEDNHVHAALNLPAVESSVWNTLAPDVEVQERTSLLLIARCTNQAKKCEEDGNTAKAKEWIAEARKIVAEAPNTPEMHKESEALTQLELLLEEGNFRKFGKATSYHSYRSRRSRRERLG